jgi:hypothetical protein
MPKLVSPAAHNPHEPEIRMNTSELAWELAELFGELDTAQINEMLAKNVPLEALEFFASYTESFAKSEQLADSAARRLPNLMLLGYLLRVLEERLLEGDDSDADEEDAAEDEGDEGESPE